MKYILLGAVERIPFKINIFLRFSAARTFSKDTNLDDCYQTLGVDVGSDQEIVRQAFIALVKRYHPDSGTPEANADKFQQIESAYRQLQDKFARDRWNVAEGEGEFGLYYNERKQQEKEEVQEFDIEHTAPQHRHYLSYGGVGSGSPFQRQKQFTKYRAAKALEHVNLYRLSKIQVNTQQALIKKEDKKKAKDIKTGFGMDRLVEDLIKESMARGDFDNLGGHGKPLKSGTHENPYVDYVTHKMNQVLIDNGFTPTWILYQKDIREKISQLITTLAKERSKLGPLPLNRWEEDIWAQVKSKIKEEETLLNDKIDTYNLMVPIMRKQMLHFSLENEAEKILKEGSSRKENIDGETIVTANKSKSSETLLDLVSAIFKQK